MGWPDTDTGDLFKEGKAVNVLTRYLWVHDTFLDYDSMMSFYASDPKWFVSRLNVVTDFGVMSKRMHLMHHEF